MHTLRARRTAPSSGHCGHKARRHVCKDPEDCSLLSQGGGCDLAKVTQQVSRAALTPDPACAHGKSLHSCPTPCHPKDCSPSGSSVHGILQARILEWVAMASSRGSSRPRDRTRISYASCMGRWVLYHQGSLHWPRFQLIPAPEALPGPRGWALWDRKAGGSCAPTPLTHGAWPPQDGGVTCGEESQDQSPQAQSPLC